MATSRSAAAWRKAPTPIVTRLHVRYDAQSFPEDLVFIETKDRSNFQGRYVLRHPFKGKATCEAGEKYQASLAGAVQAGSREPRAPDRLEAERDRDADGSRGTEREGREVDATRSVHAPPPEKRG